jgi:hypothetical protein
VTKYLLRRNDRRYGITGELVKETDLSFRYLSTDWYGNKRPVTTRKVGTFKVIEANDPKKAVDAYNAVIDSYQPAIDELEKKVVELKKMAREAAQVAMDAEIDQQRSEADAETLPTA